MPTFLARSYQVPVNVYLGKVKWEIRGPAKKEKPCIGTMPIGGWAIGRVPGGTVLSQRFSVRGGTSAFGYKQEAGFPARACIQPAQKPEG